MNNQFARVEIWQQKVKRKKIIPVIASFPYLRRLLTILTAFLDPIFKHY